MSKKRQSSDILNYFNFKRVATTDDSEKSQEHITLPQPVVAPSENHSSPIKLMISKKMCQNMKLESDGLDMHGWFNMLLGWRTLQN